jgi:predicted small lipoprotein YifL
MPDPTPVRSLCLAVLLCLACLGGCGQKGPLYLPEEEGQENR